MLEDNQRHWRGRWLLAPVLFPATLAQAEYQVNLPEPATPHAREIFDVHMLTTTIATVLTVAIILFVIYTAWRFHKSRGHEPDQEFHKGWFGIWSWVLVPVLVLGIDLTIAGSAQSILEKLWVIPKDDDMMEVKVIGHQWWWEYEYLDEGIKVQSRPLQPDQAGDLYLREVDNRLVLPTHTPIRFLHTSADVIHALWVPELGFKKDAIPGYITETWAEIDREGVFRGQCAELCGTWHSRMPVVIEAVSPERFRTWTEERKLAMAAQAAEASADRSWSFEELMEKGRGLYNLNCANCHQLNGEGLAPAFPPLKGSQIAAGPVGDHLEIVLRGKEGTAMPAWGQLNDLEIAAIVTYERNAWGNDTGDTVQPRDVAQARGAPKVSTTQ